MAYGVVNLSDVATDEKQLQDGGGSGFHKVPAAGEKVFMCPPWNERETKPYNSVKVHYNLERGPVLCLSTVGQCPACQASTDLYSLKDDRIAQSVARNLYGKMVYLYNVIPDVELVRSNDPALGVCVFRDQTKEPKAEVYVVSKKIHQMFLQLFNFYGVICDPNNGVVVMLTKTESMGNDGQKISSVFTTPMQPRCKLHPNVMTVLNSLPDLKNKVPSISYEKMKALVDVKMAQYKSGVSNTMVSSNTTTQVPNVVMYPTKPQYPVTPVNTGGISVVPVIPSVTVSPANVVITPPVTLPSVTTPPPAVTVTTVPPTQDIKMLEEFEKFLKERGK